jgi:hypothetical protein
MPARLPRVCRATFLLSVSLAACGGGESVGSSPIAGAEAPPQLLACRARVDEPFRFAEIALRDARNLGTRRIGDRAGIERGVRLHPDGNTIVFSRERTNGDPDSTEIFVSTIDGSRAEERLTQDTTADTSPCWSPDGERILWSSERGGQPRLWLMQRDGSGAQQFRAAWTGTGELEPDWHRGSGRVVWSERSALDGRLFLNSATANASPAGVLTQPPGGVIVGDTSPRFTPELGVVFVRRDAASTARLCALDIATGTVVVLLAPDGDVATPVVAPAGDRVFFGLAEPDAGRTALRLASVPLPGGGPATLLWPDERWRLEGIDVLPSLPAVRVAGEPRTVDVLAADVQIATASAVYGAKQQLVAADGDEFRLTTLAVSGRQIAGISVRFDLPVLDALDVEELRARIVLRSSRAGGTSLLRTSLYNPVDERFDTVVERPAATTATTLEFRTSSLRHVTSERQVRFTAIADLDEGNAEELFVDQVELVVVPRAN